MIAYHDASAAYGGIDRDELSSYGGYGQYSSRRREHELDELETSKTRQCLKKTTKFLFSHIGLVGLVVVYAVAGGFLFQLLEERQEKFNCQEAYGDQMVQITKLKQKLISYIQHNVTAAAVSTNGKDNTTIAFAKIGSMLLDYRQFVIQATSRYRYYGDDCTSTNKWTFANSLLFAITIMTTIGYGNVTPTTWEGQLCCICFATIGIPIFLLCVANISGVLGEMFRFIYAKIICAPCTLMKRRRAAERRAQAEQESGMGGASVWPEQDDGNKTHRKRSLNPMGATHPVEDDEGTSSRRVAVPLTVTMIIIAAYIWIGSALFHNFEGWSMTEAGYFCFITLATIGFGDFVPGQRREDPSAGPKLILGAIYVLFGMAILAMCFDLMQEEIVAKFRWLGTKFGIIEEDAESSTKSDRTSEGAQKRNSTDSTVTNNNGGTPTQRTMIDADDGDVGRERRSSSARKASPRSNIARVHPLQVDASNGGSLHQRIASSKRN